MPLVFLPDWKLRRGKLLIAEFAEEVAEDAQKD